MVSVNTIEPFPEDIVPNKVAWFILGVSEVSLIWNCLFVYETGPVGHEFKKLKLKYDAAGFEVPV